MGNTIVVNENQLIEFKSQLQILFFRLKTNGVVEEEIKTHIYTFYGFYLTDSTIRPKVVTSLTGALNGSIKEEHKQDLINKIRDLYTSEGLVEEDISRRMKYLNDFFYTALDVKHASTNSIDNTSIDMYSTPNGTIVLKSAMVHSSSFEESAEEAYVRQQDEKRKNTIKAKVVAIEAADYLMRSGTRGMKTPDVFKTPSKTPDIFKTPSKSPSLEREKTPTSSHSNGGKTTSLPIIITPEQQQQKTTPSSAIDKLKKAVSSDAMAIMRVAKSERRYSTGDLLSELSPLRKPSNSTYNCAICGAIFTSQPDLYAHINTANTHIDSIETNLRKYFEFCDPYFPNKFDEDLPYKFLITRRKLFNETREAYKADFYLHMSMNILEVALILIGKEKKLTCSLYFDNSKLNGILHRLHGIMRNSKAHQEALSSYVIDRLNQDKKTGIILFIPSEKDSKDVGNVVIREVPVDLVSAGMKQSA